MLRQSLIVSFLFSCLFSFGQIDEVRRITRTLCDSVMHGRGYVNKGDSIAAEFLAAEFQKIGVSPYAESYFQNYFIDAVNSFPGELNFSSNGEVLKPGIDYLIDPSCPSFDAKLSLERVTIHDLMDGKLITQKIQKVKSGKGKNGILLDLRNVSEDTLKLYKGFSVSLADIITVVELTDQKFTWSVGHEQLKYPLIYLKTSSYNESTEFDLKIDAKLLKNYKTQNVIAYLPAAKKCKKTLVFTAHYDHLGRMGTDTYFPGANDNASGTAMLLSMANYFVKNPSKYNIMFIAFSGEEAGLLGSNYYVANPLFPLKKIKFLINLDIMGSGEDGVTVVNGSLFKKELALLQEINEEKALLARVKKRGPAANSDHYWFTQEGVPAFFIYTEGINKNYHDVFDVYDELTFVEYDDITTLLIEFVKRLR